MKLVPVRAAAHGRFREQLTRDLAAHFGDQGADAPSLGGQARPRLIFDKFVPRVALYACTQEDAPCATK